jgi:hypothetical protein
LGERGQRRGIKAEAEAEAESVQPWGVGGERDQKERKPAMPEMKNEIKYHPWIYKMRPCQCRSTH